MKSKLPMVGVPLAAGLAVLVGLMGPPSLSQQDQADSSVHQGGQASASDVGAHAVSVQGLAGTSWTIASQGPAGAFPADMSPEYRHPEGWDVSYSPAGMECQDSAGWAMQARAVSVGRADISIPLTDVSPRHHKDGLVEYHRGPMIEWFDHTDQGVHHGMTLPERPQGHGKLLVELSVQTALQPQVFAENKSILYCDGNGDPAMAYDGLLVIDAQGKPLPSTMTITDVGLQIGVDDSEAQYPLTIDPVFDRVTPGSISLFVDRAEALAGGQWKIFYGYAHYGVDSDVVTEIPNGPYNRYTTVPVAGPTTPPTSFVAGRHVLPPITLAKKQKITWTVSYLTPEGDSKTKTSAAGSYDRKVSPIVENGGCSYIIPGSPEGRRTEWGYFNRMPFPLTFPYGGKNKLSAPSSHGGDPRPTLFLPGRHVRTHTTTWLVEGPTGGSRVVWTLSGKTATAGADRVCEPVNQAPVAHPQDLFLAEGSNQLIAPYVVDPDGDAIAGIEIVGSTLPGGITAVVEGLGIRWTIPFGTAADSAEVSYRATDSHGAVSNVATISLQEIHRLPYIGDLAIEVTAGEPTEITLDLQDTDADGVLYDSMVLDSGALKGTITGIPGDVLTYTADSDAIGPDHLQIRINESGLEDTGYIAIHINPAPAAEMSLVSRSMTTGVDGTSSSSPTAISDDGNFVLFWSYDDEMALTDGEAGDRDLYLKNNSTGHIELVTSRVSGETGPYFIGHPDVSSDGRFVVFSAGRGDFTPEDTDHSQVFLRDMQLGETTIISRSFGGALGNNLSYNPSISDDGRYVAYVSRATNIVPTDTTGRADIYVLDRHTGQTILVSSSTQNFGGGNADCNIPHISSNGRNVSYTSLATDLAPGVVGANIWNVYLYNVDSGQNVLVSRRPDNLSGNGWSTYSKCSATGDTVVFQSNSSDLTFDSVGTTLKLFEFDLATHQVRLVSKSASGVPANAPIDHSSFSLSSDGNKLAFATTATNLTGDPVDGVRDQIFVVDLSSSEVTLVSRESNGAPALYGASSPLLNGDGTIVSFSSSSPNLLDVPLVNPGVRQVYLLRDLQLVLANQ